jgi:mRNA-degrading endonuclease toxin of MazEF toxin-antitoxin module
VVLDTSDGVRERCAINLDLLATIDQSRLVERIAALPSQRMYEVFEAIRQAFDMPDV